MFFSCCGGHLLLGPPKVLPGLHYESTPLPTFLRIQQRYYTIIITSHVCL